MKRIENMWFVIRIPLYNNAMPEYGCLLISWLNSIHPWSVKMRANVMS